jgi:hypothetical protein
LLIYVPSMAEAAEECVARFVAPRSEPTLDIEEAMTESMFSVVAPTILVGIDERQVNAIKSAARSYLDPIT